MLSKNNSREIWKNNHQMKQRFALRKLTVGCASVLIGLTLMGVSTTVHADVLAGAGSQPSSEVTTPSTASSSTADFPKVGDPEQDQQLHNDGPRDTAYSSETVRIYNPGSSNVYYYHPETNGYYPSNVTINNGKRWADSTRIINVQNMTRSNTDSNNDNWSQASFNQVRTNNLNLPAHEGYDVHIVVGGISYPNDAQNYGLTGDQLVSYADRLTHQLNSELAANRYTALPAVTTTLPVDIIYNIYFIPKAIHLIVKETVNVDSLNDASEVDYTKQVGSQTISPVMDAATHMHYRGGYSTANFGAQNINNVLNDRNFTDTAGHTGQTLPSHDGYHPVISFELDGDYAAGEGIPGYTEDDFNAAKSRLEAELRAALTANPDQLPAYSTNFPIDVVFNVSWAADEPTPEPTPQPTPEPQPTPQTGDHGRGETPQQNNHGNGDQTTPATNDGGSKRAATNVRAEKQAAKKTLPQTGNDRNDAAVAGLGLMALATLFGLGLRRKN